MDYLINIGIFFTIYAILAVSLNLVVGYTGMISVAHAVFFGVGAYAAAILTVDFGMNFFLAVAAGVLLSAIIAFFAGAIFSRLGGDYYVLGTVGFNLIALGVFTNWDGLTRGPLGIPGIPRPEIFGMQFSSSIIFFIFSILILGLVYLIARFIVSSSFGRVLKAVREDEEAIRVFGYSTFWYKLAVFVASAALAALAGSIFASFVGFIDPTAFDVMKSVLIIAMVILGGFANIKGSILGALALIVLPEFLRFVGFESGIAAQMRLAIYGLTLIILMRYRPQGLLGEYKF